VSHTHVVIKGIVVSKTLTKDTLGNNIVKIEIAEEREIPGPVIMHPRDSTLAKEIIPIVSQVMRALPPFSQNKVMMPRAVLFLTEDEWDRIIDKFDIGDELEIYIEKGRITIKKSD